MSIRNIASLSQDEQDTILGRTMREYSALRGSLERIDAELEALVADLEKLRGFVNAHIRLTAKTPDTKFPEFPGTVSKYVDPSRLDTLLQEQDRLVKQIRSLGGEFNEV